MFLFVGVQWSYIKGEELIVTTCTCFDLRTYIRRSERKQDALFILCVGMIVLVMVGFFQRSVVRGHSMDPTLHDGQNVLLLRTKWNPMLQVKRGDIVVADMGSRKIIKRVIACPGDTMEIRGGQIYLNGRVLHEPYICEAMEQEDLPAVTLGEDQFFLMGDNRNRSADSRMFGTFSTQSLYGVLYLNQQPLLWTVCALLVLSIGAMACSLEPERKEVV